MPHPPTSTTRLVLEIVAVLLTACGKFIFMDSLIWNFSSYRSMFIVTVIVLWIIYIINRYLNVNNILKEWGFRFDNFWTIIRSKRFYIPALAAVSAMFLIGYLQNTINLKKEILYIMSLYPIWGTLQQFLLIGLVVGNLDRLADHLPENKRKSWHKPAILLGAAILFAAIHATIKVGNWWMLVGGTFLLAVYYGWLYRKEKNLFVLGLFHGWLAAIIFYTLVGRDVWKEFFVNIFR
jgi:uncharacterized protein